MNNLRVNRRTRLRRSRVLLDDKPERSRIANSPLKRNTPLSGKLSLLSTSLISCGKSFLSKLKAMSPRQKITASKLWKRSGNLQSTKLAWMPCRSKHRVAKRR